ncbi:glycosyltransferase [Butyrivibrio sp. MB2005]|uniref:glycosyltransferase n=1 Tax=Butyrivibrio sp. MB2005 TaxID=1280678 RepID=UPI00040BB4C8|nr:glycosyltransferase [Butyrivibrio sp. MB2005]
MKILYIINETSIGGASLSLFDFLTKENDITPLIIVPGEGSIKRIFSDAGYKCIVISFKNDICRVGKHDLNCCDSVFVNNFEAARVIANIACDEGIQIIHTNSSTSNVGMMAAAMAGIPHIWHIREFTEEHYAIESFDKQFKIQLFKSSNQLITISDSLATSFFEKYNISTTRIYNGILMSDDYSDNSDKSRYESFLFVGSISKSKGQIHAVKAVEQLVQDGLTSIKLYIIGPGNTKDCWIINKYIEQRNLADNIEVIPFTRDLDKYRELCGYAIIGSKMEALGRVTVEAMAAGNIPIGTDSGGTKELIGEDGQRGFLYKYGDYYQLASKMREAIMLDDNDRKRITDNARKFAVEIFDVSKYGNEVLNVYRNVLENDTCKGKRTELKEYLEKRYNDLCNTSDLEKTPINFKKVRIKIKENIDILGQFLSYNGFCRIVIYGMGELGCAFYDYLVENDFEIIGVMDEDADTLKDVVNVIEMGDSIRGADCILVTPLNEQIEVVRKLNILYSDKCRIVGIEEVFGNCSITHGVDDKCILREIMRGNR